MIDIWSDPFEEAARKAFSGAFIMYGPKKKEQAVIQTVVGTISLGAIIAVDLGGTVVVGMLNGQENDGYVLLITCGDITHPVELPALVVPLFQLEQPAELGRLIGRYFVGWQEFAIECEKLGMPIDLSGAGDETVFD